MMTRKEEVEKNNKILTEMIKETTNSTSITQEQVTNFALSSIAQQLVDISLTLAIIADKLGGE